MSNKVQYNKDLGLRTEITVRPDPERPYRLECIDDDSNNVFAVMFCKDHRQAQDAANDFLNANIAE